MAETKIAEIDIGGRNLLLKTAEAHTSAGSTSGNVYITSYAQSDYLASMELVANENVFTLAFDYEVVGNTDENARMWPQFHGNAPTEANVIYSNTNRPGTSKVNMYVHDNPSGRYIVTFKVSSGQISGSANINRVRLNGATDGATIKVSNFKLELGNKATDWTPAPEDFEDYTDSAVTAAKAEIKVTTDGITSTVEKIGGFKYLVSETAGTTWTTFLSYAQEGKETLFTIESGALGCRIGDNVYLKYKDTTNNVFRYIRGTVIEQPTADNKIKLVAHGYEDIRPVDTIKSTINQSADSVKIQAKHVDIEGAAIFSSGRLSETSLDAAYDTKGAAGVVQENLDNLEIGGRNLLIDTNAPSLTKIAAISDRYWSNATSLVKDGTAEIVEINDSPVKGIKYGARFSATTQRTTKRTHELAFRNNTFEAGQTYTMSFWARLVSGGVNDVRFNFQNRTTAGIVDDCRYEPTSDWKKYSWTFTPTTKVENIVVYMGIAYLNIGIIEMCGFKVEKGNRATDWTSAPEEINHMINNVGLNGKNLLTGTNTVTTVTSTGTNANRTWRKAGDGTGTITHIDVTDAPYAILTNGWQFDITSVKGSAYANSLAIAQNAVNVVAGKTYTMSCYAKGTGKLYMFVGISTFIPSDESGKIASLTNDWKRYSITFTAPSNTAVVNANGTNAFFGANGTNVSLSICGMMLEEGDTATLWSPAPGDLAFEEQRIYYRSSVSTKPNGNGLPTTWVTKNTNKWNSAATNADGWSKKVTPISDGKASGVTKFLYLFTCTQSRSVSGEVTYSEILLDDSTTVIDGGNIITGSVKANQIDVNNLFAQDITATGTIAGAKLIGAKGTFTRGFDVDILFDMTHGNIIDDKSDAEDTWERKYIRMDRDSVIMGFATDDGEGGEMENDFFRSYRDPAHPTTTLTLASVYLQLYGMYIQMQGNASLTGSLDVTENAAIRGHKMVYEAGDVVAATGIFAGHLTGSSKQIQFFVPLPKPRTPGIKCAISGNWTIRHVGGGYILNGATLQSIGTVSASAYETGVFVTVALNSAVSVTNNTPVSVNGTSNAKITFST